MGKKKIKILHLTPYYSPHLGGVETHVEAVNRELLAESAKNKQYQLQVFTQLPSLAAGRHDQSLPLKETKDGVEVIRFPATELRGKFNYKLQVWQQVLKHHQLFLQADIIHVHDVYWWLLPLYPFVWFKVFMTFHGWEGEYPVRWQAKLQRWIYSQLALKVIHVGKWIQEFYWDKPDVVIDGGVDLPSEQKVSKAKKQTMKNKKLKLVFLGRLVAENEIEKYLALIEQLKQAGYKADMTWVGDGPWQEQCHQVGKVTGWVDKADQYLHSADLVFASSYLSILQAMAGGKVVAAFYSHALKERYLNTFSGAEFLITAKDINLMKEKIIKLLNNSSIRHKLEQQARKFAEQKTWSKVAQTYEKLWGLT